MDEVEDDDEPDLEPASPDVEKALRIERERKALQAAIAAAHPETIKHRVGWVLNNYPDARNSDVALADHYWAAFCEAYNRDCITIDDLYKLPRMTSLVRERAHIQNTLKLFWADDEVREHRGTLSEKEKEARAEEARLGAAPTYAVYVDESGKTQDWLLIGGLWILHGPETHRIGVKLQEWREVARFQDELHFKEVDDKSLPYFKQAIDIVVESASALSFKYLAVKRAGLGRVQEMVPRLIYHLLVKGVEHEDRSGRAPLPRNLVVWKDAEEESRDRVDVAEINDRLKAAASAQFNRQLGVDDHAVVAVDSKANDLLQVADVFTAAIGRCLNQPLAGGQWPNAKDELARYVIERTDASPDREADDHYGDLAVRINL